MLLLGIKQFVTGECLHMLCCKRILKMKYYVAATHACQLALGQLWRDASSHTAIPGRMHSTICTTWYLVSIGSQEVEFRSPLRQSSPGPISLELFGMEETADEPLELPVQATIVVHFVPVPSSAQADSMLPVPGESSSPVKSL